MSTSIYSPTLHLNGSDGETLFEALAGALGALRAARVALRAVAPNARDYYVGVRLVDSQGDLVATASAAECPFRLVAAAHDARDGELVALESALQAIAMDVRTQLDEREERRAR